MMALLSALRNIGNCEDVKLKYFTFWRDSSLCCASFRMTRLCFLLRLEIWIIFETQRLFIILMFLRKQSGNSLANWWSVCFKMFFPNGFICVVASTGSATEIKITVFLSFVYICFRLLYKNRWHRKKNNNWLNWKYEIHLQPITFHHHCTCKLF